MTPPLLSSYEVCRQAGITYRQLDYWYRTGILTPARQGHGSGNAHRWSEADLVRVRVIKHLMAGPAKSIGTRVSVIARRLPPALDGRWLVVGAEAGAAVVDDERLVRACIKFGPSCTVVDLQSVTSVQRRAS